MKPMFSVRFFFCRMFVDSMLFACFFLADNRSKRRRNADRTRQDFSAFAERRSDGNKVHISPQLTLAAYQYLSTSK